MLNLRTAVDTGRQDTGAEIAIFSEGMYSRMDALESLVLSQHEETRYAVSQRSFRSPSAQLLPAPSVLREACDIVSSSSASSGAGIDRTPRPRGVVCSRCGCDFRETTRSVAAASGVVGRALAYELHEISSHYPSCPFYRMSSRSQTRVGTRLRAGVWGQVSVWVQASFTCTTGAGAFSISPNLNVRMMVESSPASLEIEDMLRDACHLQINQQPETEIVKRLATGERRILRMFHAGTASPHDRFRDGTTLQHVLTRSWSRWGCYGNFAPGGMAVRRLLGVVGALVDAGVPYDEVDDRQK